MNIDLKKLREAAERLIEQGSGDWAALTNYWDIANPQTIIELCDMIEIAIKEFRFMPCKGRLNGYECYGKFCNKHDFCKILVQTEHKSDCSLNNDPALPKGKCDCRNEKTE
jgi:hypothetical protein